MKILDGLKGKVETWVLKVALKKGVQRAVVAIVALAGSEKVAPIIKDLGVSLDAGQLELGLTALAITGIEALRNYLKVKKGISWL